MGCDIHPHIEVKYKGKWHHYSAPQIQRWYDLFERICGVRGDVANAIAPPRGLPDDMSDITRECWELEDGHTPTWLTAKELDELCAWTDSRTEWPGQWQHNQLGYLNGNGFSDRDKVWEDVRFICWFDN